MSRYDTTKRDQPPGPGSPFGKFKHREIVQIHDPSPLAVEAIQHMKSESCPLLVQAADTCSFSNLLLDFDKAFTIKANPDSKIFTPGAEIRSAVDGLRAHGANGSMELVGTVAHFIFKDTANLPHVAAALTAEVMCNKLSSHFGTIAFEKQAKHSESLVVGTNDSLTFSTGDRFTTSQRIPLETAIKQEAGCRIELKTAQMRRSMLNVVDINISTFESEEDLHIPRYMACAAKNALKPLLDSDQLHPNSKTPIIRIDASDCPNEWATLSATISEIVTSSHGFSAIAVKVHTPPARAVSHDIPSETGYYVVASAGGTPGLGELLDIH